MCNIHSCIILQQVKAFLICFDQSFYHQGEGWEVSDMFATNEAEFGYRSTYNEAMPEYTWVILSLDPNWK